MRTTLPSEASASVRPVAGQPRSRAVASEARTPHQRTRRRSAKRSTAYAELVRIAMDQGATLRAGTSSADALQECLDRAVGGMRYAASEVDKLTPEEFWVRKYDAQGNELVEPNKWYQLEMECRAEVANLAGLMSKLGLAERAVRVQEAQVALVVGAIRDAARHVGIEPDKVVALGRSLRERLAEVRQLEQAS